MSMIPERKSMSSLRLPVSDSSSKVVSTNETSASERPGSPTSTSSPRPSVSGMKELIPLKLQQSSPRPHDDVDAWLRATASNFQSPVTYQSEPELEEDFQEPKIVPWMLSPQNIQFPKKLRKDSYREMPIYSDPGSPRLTRAYSVDTPVFNTPNFAQVPFSKSNVNRLRIVEDYELPESDDSGEASVADCAELFDVKRKNSIETSPTSFAPSRISGLSIMCKGEYNLDNEHHWMEHKLEESLEEDFVAPGLEEPGYTSFRDTLNTFDGWVDSASSEASSPRQEDVFDVSIRLCSEL
jgi:hypothetical protein